MSGGIIVDHHDWPFLTLYNDKYRKLKLVILQSVGIIVIKVKKKGGHLNLQIF